MSSRIKFILVIFLLCLGVACGYLLGVYFYPVENQAAEISCPSTMADIIQSAKGNVYEIDDPNYVEPKSYYLVTYGVNGDQITNPVFDSIPNDLKDEQQDNVSQKAAWQIFITLIPAEDRQMVTQYIIFTDGYSNTLAAVDQTEDDLTNWILEIDTADLEDRDALLFTLIHEYAHLLTLNESQVNVDEDVFNDPYNLSLLEEKSAACPDYFTDGGCSHPNSYINAFYQQFWVDINAEWEKIDALQYNTENFTPYYDGLYNFYLAQADQFLDDYSTTHPTEDIAESFAYFVFSPKPTGTLIRDQKILFFYDYPELIELRQSILQGTCSTIQ